LGTLLALRVVPTGAPPARQPFDRCGALLLFVSLLCFLLALTLGPKSFFLAPGILGLGAVALLTFLLFVRTELRTAQPMVELRLFKNQDLFVNLLTGLLSFVGSAGLVLLLPFYLQNLQARTPQQAGLLLVVAPLTMGIVAPLSGWLSDRFGTRPLTTLGLAFLVVGYLLVGSLQLSTSGTGYIARVVWIGLGMGIFQSPNNSAIMGAVTRDRLGQGSGLLSLTRTLGQTTGVALIGALWALLAMAAPGGHAGDVTAQPIENQLEALQWVARGIALMLTFALALAFWSWRAGRRQQQVSS
jgi:MFS family permease